MARGPSFKIASLSAVGIAIVVLSILPIIQTWISNGATSTGSDIHALDHTRAKSSIFPEVQEHFLEPRTPDISIPQSTSDHHNDSGFAKSRALHNNSNNKRVVADFTFPPKEKFKAFNCKGFHLAYILQSPVAAGDKATTGFDSYFQLATWGWVNEIDAKGRDVEYGEFDGVGERVGEVVGHQYEWRNLRAYAGEMIPEGVTYHRTDATYDNVFWPEQGVIVSNMNEGPDYMIKTEKTPYQSEGDQEWDPDKDRGPDLSQWSDVVYLTWKKETTEEQRPGLKHVFRRYVTNDDTKDMLAYVMRLNWPDDADPGRAPMWPERKVFTPTMPGFNALLYTPNVRGIMWLLTQHHVTFGRKKIGSITAYLERSSPGYAPCLDIKIADGD